MGITIKLSDLVDAHEFVSATALSDHQAYICKTTGRIIYVADGRGTEEDSAFPEDPHEADYWTVPDRHELDLGRRVAMAFVAETLPDLFDEAYEIFRKKGAYKRFNKLLEATDTLQKWHAFEAIATDTALKEWCADVGVAWIEK